MGTRVRDEGEQRSLLTSFCAPWYLQKTYKLASSVHRGNARLCCQGAAATPRHTARFTLGSGRAEDLRQGYIIGNKVEISISSLWQCIKVLFAHVLLSFRACTNIRLHLHFPA